AMRGEGLKLSPAEYLLLSAPHGNDGVLLRQRKEIYPEAHVSLHSFDCSFLFPDPAECGTGL
ncbi:MAG: hypothetical protein JXA79_03585, partial [Deltaproteobacteria bacterium]|nr:hypothetical protein [Deltaproteobacteria bacterium]